jgi:predicted ATPase
MPKIIIKNIGAIKSATLDINKVNVIMGQQSSGKSTIAKIISYCMWVEKRNILDGFFREDFLTCLKTYHNLDDAYFQEKSSFKYESDNCCIDFSNKRKDKCKIDVKKVSFENRKQAYIPSERNFVATIPNLGKFKETNNNIMSFLYDWYDAKRQYTKDNKLIIPELSNSFYHAEKTDRDVIILNDGTEINLQNSSSGIQSMTPLYLLIDYLTDSLYDNKIIITPFEKEKIAKMGYEEYAEKLNYKCTNLIIEEPENNLFPSTQRDLIYHLIKIITGKRNHKLTITTHSPYILYALNNCMLANIVSNKITEKDKKIVKCISSTINPKDVSVYQIHNGTLKNIQKEDGLIGENFFDEKMKEIMDDFYVLLKYYDA